MTGGFSPLASLAFPVFSLDITPFTWLAWLRLFVFLGNKTLLITDVALFFSSAATHSPLTVAVFSPGLADVRPAQSAPKHGQWSYFSDLSFFAFDLWPRGLGIPQSCACCDPMRTTRSCQMTRFVIPSRNLPCVTGLELDSNPRNSWRSTAQSRA